ncbi:uncharacterized protein LOC119588094 [Penaeus monodon]|uniref:uncharacterized protein LOC119588094 n=1 Tax=Penaeus monodon TaxID=6687 RepID=UPI0018A6EFB7|nr:uncharacterized protein LOC119588094 [Penaeus monodon]
MTMHINIKATDSHSALDNEWRLIAYLVTWIQEATAGYRLHYIIFPTTCTIAIISEFVFLSCNIALEEEMPEIEDGFGDRKLRVIWSRHVMTFWGNFRLKMTKKWPKSLTNPVVNMAMAELRLNRLQVLRNHLSLHNRRVGEGSDAFGKGKVNICPFPSSATSQMLKTELEKIGVNDVEVEPSPPGLEEEYSQILTPPAIRFVADLTRQFSNQVDLMLKQRMKKKLELDITGNIPFFPDNPEIREDWNAQSQKNYAIDFFHQT